MKENDYYNIHKKFLVNNIIFFSFFRLEGKNKTARSRTLQFDSIPTPTEGRSDYIFFAKIIKTKKDDPTWHLVLCTSSVKDYPHLSYES